MRRLVFTSVLTVALALPAAALARAQARGGAAVDGTLVIRNADNGDGAAKGSDVRPVVTLVVSGFVIGRVTDQGRIQIYDLDPSDQGAPEVTGAGPGRNVSYGSFAGSEWTGNNFRFRAVQGTYRVVIWGSGVYVFASGQGKVWMTGNAADPTNDGQYSLDGNDFVSLPLKTPTALPYVLGG